uniref:Uncharacterized protein n=1 Tax=Timema genevievae TaxID=629358 RepID=A0A7R9JRU4_TIMGE|nr:unnamed protein product [Timema genevievae]
MIPSHYNNCAWFVLIADILEEKAIPNYLVATNRAVVILRFFCRSAIHQRIKRAGLSLCSETSSHCFAKEKATCNVGGGRNGWSRQLQEGRFKLTVKLLLDRNVETENIIELIGEVLVTLSSCAARIGVPLCVCLSSPDRRLCCGFLERPARILYGRAFNNTSGFCITSIAPKTLTIHQESSRIDPVFPTTNKLILEVAVNPLEHIETERYKKVFWKDVKVGDLIHLSNNEFIPADVLVLRSSDPHGLCYIDTCNLDGETNLKQRQVPRGFIEKVRNMYCKVNSRASHRVTVLDS